jgi:uridylate kinase
MLKLSGEAFGGGRLGVDPDILAATARQVADIVASGVQVCVVVGGGNFFRGTELQTSGMDRSKADYIGMLGTVMNALALQDSCQRAGVEARVQTAITMVQVAESYIPLRAIRHMEKGRVVIFGAGTGMPYFTTDTVAAQRALEVGCEVILMGKNGADGVFDSDPRTNPAAKLFAELSYDEFLGRNLKAADATAISMARDYGLPMVFFNLDVLGNIAKVVAGQPIGTRVHV